MNFTETFRRPHITIGKIIVAYRSLSLTVMRKTSVPTDLIKGTPPSKMQTRRPQLLHEPTVLSFRSLIEVTLSGIVCRTKCRS